MQNENKAHIKLARTSNTRHATMLRTAQGSGVSRQDLETRFVFRSMSLSARSSVDRTAPHILQEVVMSP